MGAGEGVGEGKGVSVLDGSLSGNVEVGKGGAHSGEEEAIPIGTRNLTFGGVVIDAFGGQVKVSIQWPTAKACGISGRILTDRSDSQIAEDPESKRLIIQTIPAALSANGDRLRELGR